MKSTENIFITANLKAVLFAMKLKYMKANVKCMCVCNTKPAWLQDKI